MAPFLLLLNATKIIGVAGVILISVDSLFYRAFRKKNLLPFDSPIDEDDEVLARFAIDKDVDDGGFFFALATAPAHVEDNLRDAWLEFAKEDAYKDAKATGEPDIRDELAQTTPGTVSLREEREAAQIFAGTGSSAGLASPPEEIAEVAQGAQTAGQKEGGGSPNTPNSGVTDWTFLSDGSDNDKADDSRGSSQYLQKGGIEAHFQEREEEKEEELVDTEGVPELGERPKPVKRRQGKTTEASSIVFNPPRKVKQLGKVAMEAMLRGIHKVSEVIDETGEESFNVAAWQNAFHPEERLRFWSEPDTELKLAQEANVSVFRMGVDWSRIVPVEPVNGTAKAVKWEAVKRYRYILEKVRACGMKVMLTLFHHSLPVWAAQFGGWKNAKTTKYFVEFSRLVVEQYADLVDFWVTFNEPHVFTMLTYCAGAWPGGDPNLLETATSVLPKGVFKVVMASMAESHNQAYDIIHDICNKLSRRAKVGVAHHVSFMRPYGLPDVPLVMLSDWMTRFAFIDDVVKKLDYIGINYYGQEVVSAPGLKLVEMDEYSESGRGVYPDGLYRALLSFHDRYKKYQLPYIITENGVSDSSDFIRRPYITEHLLAVRAAMAKGVPVQGYCFWTTSDNWEWADGYGPKFGLVAVDRHNNLARTPRPSYYLYAEIAKTGLVTKQQRDQAWEELMNVAAEGKKRPFCRAVDGHGLMYSGGLDVPIELPFVERDWRFGHYEMEGLQDPVSRFVRFILSGAFLGRKKKGAKKEDRPPEPYRAVPSLRSEEAEEAVPAMA
ncbi:unnamed protein product [Calypogeia fissa]